MQVKEEKLVSWAEAKQILEKKVKEKKLGYEQKNALDFLRKFSKLSSKKAEEMTDELGKLERLKEKHIINIIDFLPQDLDDLRILFANEIITLSEDEKKKIISIVKKFI